MTNIIDTIKYAAYWIYHYTVVWVALVSVFMCGVFYGQVYQPFSYSDPIIASRMAIYERQGEIGTNKYQREDLFFDPF